MHQLPSVSSVLLFKYWIKIQNLLSFYATERNYMMRKLLSIDEKSVTGNSTPSKTLKLSVGISEDVLQNLF